MCGHAARVRNLLEASRVSGVFGDRTQENFLPTLSSSSSCARPGSLLFLLRVDTAMDGVLLVTSSDARMVVHLQPMCNTTRYTCNPGLVSPFPFFLRLCSFFPPLTAWPFEIALVATQDSIDWLEG